MANRMPWAQRPMRGLAPAREVALAAEQILVRYVADGVVLDRILNMIELSVNQQLQAIARGGQSSSGFDPVTGAPSRSNLEYQHRARTAQELKDTAHLVPGPVGIPPEEPPLASPQPPIPKPPNPRPQPNATPQRPSSDSMPWV